MKNESNLFQLLFFFLTIFSFFGWYMAETDNEILRQELATQSYIKPIKSEN